MSWFAAKTKFKGEFKALDFFKSIGVKSYVPYFKTKRVWSDRIKKVTVPAISGYVFFYLPKINYELVNINPFTSTHRYFFIVFKRMFLFNNINILNSKTISRS